MYLARSGSPGSRTASAYSPGSARTWIGMGADSIEDLCGDCRRPDARAGARILRARAGRARLPRGRRAPRSRSVRRDVEGGDGHARGALPHRREPRAVGRRAAASSPRLRPQGRSRMIIGEAGAVTALWDAARDRAAARRARTGPASRSTRSTSRPRRARPGSAPRRPPTSTGSLPACAAAHELELGDRPAGARPRGVPLAHVGADRRGPLVALARGRRRALQGGGIRVDAARGADPAGVGRPGGARPRLRGARPARPLPAAARDDAGA